MLLFSSCVSHILVLVYQYSTTILNTNTAKQNNIRSSTNVLEFEIQYGCGVDTGVYEQVLHRSQMEDY